MTPWYKLGAITVVLFLLNCCIGEIPPVFLGWITQILLLKSHVLFFKARSFQVWGEGFDLAVKELPEAVRQLRGAGILINTGGLGTTSSGIGVVAATRGSSRNKSRKSSRARWLVLEFLIEFQSTSRHCSLLHFRVAIFQMASSGNTNTIFEIQFFQRPSFDSSHLFLFSYLVAHPTNSKYIIRL